MTLDLLLTVAAAYLIGSIPVGLLIGKAHGIDIRTRGSGNIGATNLGRALGRAWGLTCFVLDVLKGLLPVLAAGYLFGWAGRSDLTGTEIGQWLLIGVLPVIGHVFPVYLKFKGGKGVATGLGVVLGIWPLLTVPALMAALTWLLFAGALRYVGLASVAAAVGLPLYYLVIAEAAGWSLDDTWLLPTGLGVMALLIVFRHRGNLIRLARGTEARLGE